MMAKGGEIAKDTLFEPERLAARAVAPKVRLRRNDWDQSDRGLPSGRAAIVLQSRRRIHGRSRNHASFDRDTLAPREPSIHGSSTMANEDLEAFDDGVAESPTKYGHWRGFAFLSKGLFDIDCPCWTP